MKPTIGRIVHTTGSDGKVSAAIVTGVYDNDPDRIDCIIFVTARTETGLHPMLVAVDHMARTDAPAGYPEAHGRWAWPPRVA